MSVELILSGIACILALVSVALRVYRPEDLDQLARDLRAYQAELVDLDERVTTWQRRENVRRSRDKKAELQEAQDDEPPAGSKKSLLRARLRALKGARNVVA